MQRDVYPTVLAATTARPVTARDPSRRRDADEEDYVACHSSPSRRLHRGRVLLMERWRVTLPASLPSVLLCGPWQPPVLPTLPILEAAEFRRRPRPLLLRLSPVVVPFVLVCLLRVRKTVAVGVEAD